MADNKAKHPENVAGAWYVDTSCIQCGLCSEYAPAVFKVSEDMTQNVVYHQPVNQEEIKAAEESKESCPVDAIGNDGLQTDLNQVPEKSGFNIEKINGDIKIFNFTPSQGQAQTGK